MTGRLVLRVKCDVGKHSVAKVTATSTGYAVEVKEAVLTGYGNRVKIVKATYLLDGPSDDPQTWFCVAACECGRQYDLRSTDLRDKITTGAKVLTLIPRDTPEP